MALLTAGVLIAQIVTGVLVTVLPPPRPPIYHLGEVAEALRGGSLQAGYGRRLERSETPAPPIEEPDRRGDGQSRQDLATLMSLPAASVHFHDLGLDGSSRWAAAALSPWRPPHMPGRGFRPPGQRPPYTRDGAPWGRAAACPPGAAGAFGGPPGVAGDPGRLVLGDFVAAVQRPQGDWTVVRPIPEGFPNDWERRVLLWFGLSLMLVLPPGYLFARRITAPLRGFAAAADRFGKDPNAPSFAPGGPAEVGVAARAFNEMQIRLKRYVQDRTAMVGAISHDLRTPLARLRFRMERAPAGTEDGGVEADLTPDGAG